MLKKLLHRHIERERAKGVIVGGLLRLFNKSQIDPLNQYKIKTIVEKGNYPALTRHDLYAGLKQCFMFVQDSSVIRHAAFRRFTDIVIDEIDKHYDPRDEEAASTPIAPNVYAWAIFCGLQILNHEVGRFLDHEAGIDNVQDLLPSQNDMPFVEMSFYLEQIKFMLNPDHPLPNEVKSKLAMDFADHRAPPEQIAQYNRICQKTLGTRPFTFE